MKEKLIQMLTNIGFSRIESEIYSTLMGQPAMTGYKIAKLISKSRSNVYQALRTLKQKGGIVELRAKNTKHFKAIPIENIYDQKERELLAEKKIMVEAFKKFKDDEETDIICNFDKLSQVYTKANEMIGKAEKIIFVDVQLSQLENIRAALETAGKRGIKVAVLGDNDYNLKECEVFDFQEYAPEGKQYVNWPMNWFCIAVDAREFLIATIKKNNEDIIYSIWSNNQYISSWIYSDMLYEIAFSNIVGMFKSGLSREQIWLGIEEYAQKYLYEAPAIIELKEKMIQE